MKKIFAVVLFLAIMIYTPMAGAYPDGNVYSPIVSGKTATMTLNGHTYDMVFQQGPFGPMESGDVDISVDGVFWNSETYYVDDSTNTVRINGLGDFKYLTGGNLIWSQTPVLIFQVK